MPPVSPLDITNYHSSHLCLRPVSPIRNQTSEWAPDATHLHYTHLSDNLWEDLRNNPKLFERELNRWTINAFAVQAHKQQLHPGSQPSRQKEEFALHSIAACCPPPYPRLSLHSN
ncbi:hypothetical protein ECG_07527 [Echinococcus granulosus]|nr:hypothetical protein ECG_07527 [Echinococcus granulosus]